MLRLTGGLTQTVRKRYSPARSTQIIPTTLALLAGLVATRIRIPSERRPCSTTKMLLHRASCRTRRNTLRSRSSRAIRTITNNSINEKEAFTVLQTWLLQPLTSLTRILELLSLSTKASITSANDQMLTIINFSLSYYAL